jgi:hypothetical protein
MLRKSKALLFILMLVYVYKDAYGGQNGQNSAQNKGLSSPATNITYYVDATDGKDSNSGTSEATPWKTIAKVNMLKFQPGDQILFKRGDVWREQLTVPSSGSAGRPINFGAYGSGPDPIITGADIVNGLTQIGGMVYQKKGLTIEPRQVFYNHIRLKLNAGVTTEVGSNEWDWVSDTLYINVGENPARGMVEISRRAQAIWNARNYITFSELHITKSDSTTFGNIVSSGNNVTIENCEISYAAHHGIAYIGSGDNLLTSSNIHHNGTQSTSSAVFGYQDAGTLGHENYISHNDIHHNHAFGIQLLSNYYIIEHNTVYNNGNKTDMTGGIEIIDWTQSGYGQHQVIRYNTVYGQISGIDDGEGIFADDFSRYVDIYYNIVYGNDGPGIGSNGAKDVNIYNNVSYENSRNSSGSLNTKAEIKAVASNPRATSNLVIKNNIAMATDVNTYAIYVGPYVYNSDGLIITNNIWYSSAANWYYWNNAGGNNLSTWNALPCVGTDLNSNPLFVSTSDFHLQASSPAIDAGTDVGLNQDYQGLRVPLGRAPDIGAFEYRLFPSMKSP